MNQLSLIGNLTKDPTLRYTPTGKPVCDLRVAVNGVSDAPPLFLDVATFGPQAEACARHLHKGRQVAFTGQLVYREWVQQDGTKRSRHSAVGRVQFLGAPPADAPSAHGDGDETELDAIIAPAEEAEQPA